MNLGQFDLVELLVDQPEYRLRSGERGAIVECLGQDNYLVEFCTPEGETIALCTLPEQTLMQVWQASTNSWVSTTDQINTLLRGLPHEMTRQVLDFVRFVHAQGQPNLTLPSKPA